jgi:glycosyltransferase involved in cell wall biosynthesis
MTSRVIFVNRFFHPDHSASSRMLSALAFHLAEAGRNVAVITGRQLYDRPAAELSPFEIMRGVAVHRVASTRFGRRVMAGRALDDLSFYPAIGRAIRAIAKRDDIVVAMTDPPLASIPAMWAARRCGARLVNWLQDLYPEIAERLGVAFVRGPMAGALRAWRNPSLRDAAANVVVGDCMAARVAELHLDAGNIHVIPNWSDDDSICPACAAENPLRRDWGLADKFVVGYSGNLGRAHEFGTILGAAERLRDRSNIIFLCIGGGHSFDELARCVHERGLNLSFRFLPYQEERLLSHTLGVPDVHWISLRPEVEGLAVPSKFYGIAAAGRAIIAITAKDGAFAEPIKQHQCGWVIEPGQPERLADTIIKLAGDPALCAAAGANARAMLDARFTRRQAFARWRRLLDDLTNPPL